MKRNRLKVSSGIVCGFLLILTVGCKNDANSTEALTVAPEASRTSGVAPLSVQFYAGWTPADSGLRDFHHYDYTWNFGDTGSGNWGTNDKSKNTAKGPIAAHIFETAGTYNVGVTVKAGLNVIRTESFSIIVQDPDTVYGGINTTCVNVSGDSDFTGAPTGSRHVSTNDLTTVVDYATAGSRVLFKRGSSWTVSSNLNWPGNAGPVTIGAYGTGISPDSQGIYSNNPHITVTNDGRFFPMDDKQDWRVMDLHLTDSTRTYHAFSGSESMQRQLYLRLKIEGFVCGFVWAHWNASQIMSKDQMVVASCNISDSGSNDLFGGSERLAILGNIFKDSHESQVVRLWLTNHGVVEHNIISGASIDKTYDGREALKFHSPNREDFGTPTPNNGIIDSETEYSIISDNIIGSSGPFPFSVGPENFVLDERVSNIIIERNWCIADYGTITHDTNRVQHGLNIWGRYCTVRNNILDGTGGTPSYVGIAVWRSPASPVPAYNEIYNNTVYRSDTASDIHRGIQIESTATLTTVRNNLMSFPYATGPMVYGLVDEASDTVSSNDLFTKVAGFIDPNNATPLSRDFRLQGTSPAINQGYSVPVYEDYEGNVRPNGIYDIGAFEYQ